MSGILQLWNYLQSQGGKAGSNVPLPAGIIADFGGAVAPTGWQLCDGSAISRTTFAALFTAIGTTFGAGNGTTTFNVPDCRGRSPVGAGTGAGLSPRALAATGGEETHVLLTAELAAHTHTIQPNNAGYSASIHDGSIASTPGSANLQGTGESTDAGFAIGSGGPYASDSQGSDTAHNTMHPFIALTKIISTGL